MTSRQDEIARFEQAQGAQQELPQTMDVDFDVQLLPMGGRSFLHLWQKPRVTLDLTRWKLVAEGWGVEVDPGEAHAIPRELARKFLSLWRKAQQGCLTEQDSAQWLTIVDQVDTARFAADQEPPRYIEAELLERATEPKIRLHDGTLVRLPAHDASLLSLVNQGEWFGAHIKFGRDGGVVSLERPMLIGSLPTDEELGGWPPPVSA